ncbi:MAG: diguanylate cyclase domain-containing protein [Myxococcales bacterium]
MNSIRSWLDQSVWVSATACLAICRGSKNVIEEVPSVLPYARRLEAIAWARGERPNVIDERMLRFLRIAETLGQATCVAVSVIDEDTERSRAIIGSPPYFIEASEAPLAAGSVDLIVEADEIAKERWPKHPIVQRVATGGSLVARRTTVQQRGAKTQFHLYLAARKQRWEQSELTALDDLCHLMGNEAVAIEERIDIARERVKASIEVAKLYDQLEEQHWLYRQIVHQLPHRSLFVFDHELKLRLVDGTVSLPGALGRAADPIGMSLLESNCGEHATLFVAECRRTLAGEHTEFLVDCCGRSYDIRTTPINDRSGTVRFGMGLLHDITEESERFVLERLLSARLSALVDSLDAAVLVEDERGIIQHCNQQFCDLLQIPDSPASFVGGSSKDLVRRISPLFFIPEALEEGIEEAINAHQMRKDELIYLADMRILERCYSPLEVDGQGAGHLWTYRDVTTRESNKDLLQRQADQLRALSLVDELTGLYNRRGFLTLATQQLKLCDRSLRTAMVVFVDLDGMKRINDELGHEYGDQALIETASVLRQCFRYSDVVARLGGDEFVVLAVEADPPTLDLVSERLYEKLAEMNQKPGRAFQLQFSVGIAPYDPAKSEMIEEVLARADNLMYESKRQRKCARS